MVPEFADLIAEYEAALAWLRGLIRDPTGQRFLNPRPPAEKRARLEAGLARMQQFMTFAGRPHTHFPSVHVAGTSGKGSVTLMIAALLAAAGQRVADHVSPYLQIPNEKLRLNGRMIPPSALTALIHTFRDLHTRWLHQAEPLLYGEAWVALTMLWFAAQRPAWGVVETGLGGRFDPTNVLPAGLAVITNVDYDHLQALGPTLADIAWHKAGIIKPGGLALTAETRPETLAILAAEAQQQGATLRQVSYTWQPERGLSVATPVRAYTHLPLRLTATYQATNAALAIAAVDWLAVEHGFTLTPHHILSALQDFKLPGRFEIMPGRPAVVLDGAHNPHKMRTLVASLRAAYPQRRVMAIVGMIYSKDAGAILEALAPAAAHLIVTRPQVWGKPAHPPETLADWLAEHHPQTPVQTIPDVQQALDMALAQAEAERDVVVVTGSMYLVGEARERWHPRLALLRELEEVAAVPLAPDRLPDSAN